MYHGYHIPQNIFATNPLTIDDAINKYHISPFYSIEYQKKNNTKSFFASHIMGEFYKSERRPITPEMVRYCLSSNIGLMKPSEIATLKDNQQDSINVSMGVDFGSGNPSNTVVSILIHWKKSNRIQLAYIDKRSSEHQLDQAEHINKLFRASRCDIGVGDLGYGAIHVKVIQDGGSNRTTGKLFPGVGSENFYGCRSINNESKPMQVHPNVIDEHGEEIERISIDITTQIQKFVDLIGTSIPHPTKKDRSISKLLIPFHADREYETDWLVSDFTSVTRKDLNKKDLDPRQNARKEFNHPKDSMMSIIYALVGLEQDTEWHHISA